MNNNELSSMDSLFEECFIDDVESSKPFILYQDLGPWGQDNGTEDLLSNSSKRLAETSALTDKISQNQLPRTQEIEGNSQPAEQNSPKTLKKENAAQEWFFKREREDENSQMKETDFLRPRRLKSLHSPKPPRMNRQSDYSSKSLIERRSTLSTEVTEDLFPHRFYDLCSISPADIELDNNIKIPNSRRLKTDFPEFQIKQSEIFKQRFEMLLQVKPFSRCSGFSTPVSETQSRQIATPLQRNFPIKQIRTPSRNLRNRHRNYQSLRENNGKIIDNISINQDKVRQQSSLKSRHSKVMSPIAQQLKQHENYSTNNIDDSQCSPYLSRFPLIAIDSRSIQPFLPIIKESKQHNISKTIGISNPVSFSNKTKEKQNSQSVAHSPNSKFKQRHLFLTPI